MPVPFIPVPNTLEARIGLDIRGQRMIMLLHFTYSGAPGATERAALNTAMHTFWTNQLKPTLTNEVALSDITVTDMSSSSAPQTVAVINPVEPGTIALGCAPTGSALCVTHRTNLRGRSFRGRSYVPGMVYEPGSQLPTNFNLSRVSAVVSAFSWLLTAANTAAGIWSVVSKFANLVPRSSGLTTPITAVSADQFIDSQRRRLAGRGV